MEVDASRRDFIKGAFAFGGLVASANLPSFADDPSLFPQRGRWERLSLCCQHIKAGASRPFSILHISDTHLTDAYPDEDEKKQSLKKWRTRTFGGRQEEALRDSIAWAKEHVDLVVHTGDMIDFQSRANFDLVRKYFGGGMFGCIGNHEYSRNMEKIVENEAYKDGTREQVAAAFPFDISVASNVVNGVNFVSLDNVYDTVTTEQADRFEDEAKKGLPIVLCVHCPLVTPRIRRAGAKFWQRDNLKAIPDASRFRPKFKDDVTADFAAYLKSLPQLKAILAGHIHISVADRFSPTAIEYCVGGNFLFHGQEITIE